MECVRKVFVASGEMHIPTIHDLEAQINNSIQQEEKEPTNMTQNSLTNLNSNGTSKQTHALLRQYQLAQFCQQGGDYSGLDNPEISLNLQSLIEDSQISEEFFPDIFPNQGKQILNSQSRHPTGFYGNDNASRALAYMPQPVHSTVAYSPPQHSPNSESSSSFHSDVTSIKEEPFDSEFFGAVSNPFFSRNGNNFNNIQHQLTTLRNQQNMVRKSGKLVDKESVEYRNKRIRNNIAVRKSRAKANQRKLEIEEKNRTLQKENERLRKQMQIITEELSMLKSLVTNFGISPEQMSKDLNKHLHSFQMQQMMQS